MKEEDKHHEEDERHDFIYDDGTVFGLWGCDALVELYGFDPERARLWMDDLIKVDNGTFNRPTCEESCEN